MPKNVHTTTQLHSFHMLPKKCWKFSKLGFNSMWPKNFQMFKLPGGSEGKASACNLEDLCSIPEEGISWEDPLEKEMATHSSILAWRIPWTEEPGRLQFMGSQRVGHDWATSLSLSPFQRNQRLNCQYPLDQRKSKRVPEKYLLLLYWLCQSL